MKKLMAFLFLLFSSLAAFSQQSFYLEKLAEFSKMRAVDSTDIVMLGDEFTEYCGDWNVLLRWKHIRNRGIAGDNISGLSSRLSSILHCHPKAVFIMIGARDILDGASTEAMLANYKSLLHHIRQHSPRTKIFVQSILPVNESFGNDKVQGKMAAVAHFNRRLRVYCQANGYAYINLFKSFVRRGTNELRRELTQDGYALSPFGYKLWAFELKKYMIEL